MTRYNLKAYIFFFALIFLMPTAAEDKNTIAQQQTNSESWKTTFINEPIFNSTIHVVESGNKNKQTILLVHGLNQEGHETWWEVIPALSQDYHVLALDLPGFGQSSKPKGRYSPTNYAKVINWLVKEYTNKPVIAVGHSMGGSAVLRFASDFPDQVKKLIVIDIAGILEQTAFIKRSANLPLEPNKSPNALKRITAQLKDFSSSLVENLTVLPNISKKMEKSDVAWNAAFAGNPNLNAATALSNENFAEAIRTLPHETVLIWGELDKVTPLSTGIMLSERLPNASLMTIKEGSHSPMRSHLKEFNDTLLRAITLTPTPEKKEQTDDPDSQGDLICNRENGQIYSGRYDNIIINNCTGIILNEVSAKTITLRDSLVEMINTQVKTDAKEPALTTYESVLIATSSTFKGDVGIFSDGSRVDLAGVSVYGNESAINIGVRSRFIFSVSDISSKKFTGDAHGVYRYRNTNLDHILAQKK